jgi:hypothetical protein
MKQVASRYDKWAEVVTFFTLFSYVAYFSTFKLEGICSSETPVDFQRVTWRYIPKDENLQ